MKDTKILPGNVNLQNEYIYHHLNPGLETDRRLSDEELSMVSKIEKKINYEFRVKSFCLRAFIHKSVKEIYEERGLKDYELLEFLGDSVHKFFCVQ